jgi:hypothetical protein
MDRVPESRRTWVRMVILRGDHPVRRFQQATRKEQTYGLIVVCRELLLAARAARAAGVLGISSLLVSLLLPGAPMALVPLGGVLLLAALLLFAVARSRRRALRRLICAQALTFAQLALVKRIARGSVLSGFRRPTSTPRGSHRALNEGENY